ncbi:MAG: hypothetical protein JST91_08595 [Actinobacteria bacterium]|nr:hypothetical protein [Actinomycetota bacterium]
MPNEHAEVTAVILKATDMIGHRDDGSLMVMAKPGSVKVAGNTVQFTALVTIDDVEEFYLPPAARLARG